uniref:Bifunctional inhibitor/plant lipid transfer protein/seed storage helical domain-containing protein n=1 Tax=Phaseolus vulgaris TaxID=3885 RepID=V7BCX5_PHAVU|nr:hypothetical protein PHAVU_008G271900g [Phaseolus vulgaris]ESW14331.1 hypothetical protein PHAVU_008G271900g [Phaseolus vulgaris]
MKPSIASMFMLILKMDKKMFAGARTMLVVCGIVVMVMVNLPLISAQAECGDVLRVSNECGGYIQRFGGKTPPSQQCCDALGNTDVKCLCRYLGRYEMFYSMEKIVYVLNECKMPLPSGTQCGSYTAP